MTNEEIRDSVRAMARRDEVRLTRRGRAVVNVGFLLLFVGGTILMEGLTTLLFH